MTVVEFLESQYNFNKQLFKSDFESAKEMEKDQKGYSEEDVREMLFMALYEPQEECCTTHTKDSIVRKVLKSFKTQ
jgi:hypothetical protein